MSGPYGAGEGPAGEPAAGGRPQPARPAAPARTAGTTLLLVGAALVAAAIAFAAVRAFTGGGGGTPAKVEAFAAGREAVPLDAKDEGGFRVLFPDKPERHEQQVPAAGTTLRLVQYTAELSGDTGFSAGWFRLPQAPAAEAVETFLQSTMSGSVSAINGKVEESSRVTAAGKWPAMEYVATAPDDHFVKARVVLVGADVFILQAVSDRRDPVGYQRFVDSFEVPGR